MKIAPREFLKVAGAEVCLATLRDVSASGNSP
jgi:hypothetical protein